MSSYSGSAAPQLQPLAELQQCEARLDDRFEELQEKNNLIESLQAKLAASQDETSEVENRLSKAQKRIRLLEKRVKGYAQYYGDLTDTENIDLAAHQAWCCQPPGPTCTTIASSGACPTAYGDPFMWR